MPFILGSSLSFGRGTTDILADTTQHRRRDLHFGYWFSTDPYTTQPYHLRNEAQYKQMVSRTQLAMSGQQAAKKKKSGKPLIVELIELKVPGDSKVCVAYFNLHCKANEPVKYIKGKRPRQTSSESSSNSTLSTDSNLDSTNSWEKLLCKWKKKTKKGPSTVHEYYKLIFNWNKCQRCTFNNNCNTACFINDREGIYITLTPEDLSAWVTMMVIPLKHFIYSKLTYCVQTKSHKSIEQPPPALKLQDRVKPQRGQTGPYQFEQHTPQPRTHWYSSFCLIISIPDYI